MQIFKTKHDATAIKLKLARRHTVLTGTILHIHW